MRTLLTLITLMLTCVPATSNATQQATHNIDQEIITFCAAHTHDAKAACETAQQNALANVTALINNVEPHAGNEQNLHVDLDIMANIARISTLLECLTTHTSPTNTTDYVASLRCANAEQDTINISLIP